MRVRKVHFASLGNLPKNIHKLKETKNTFYSPSDELVLPALSTIKPEEREFVVDSGASMHMDSRKDSNKAELENVRISKNPTKVVTANGEVLTKEEATENVRELDLFVTVMICSSFEFLMAYASIADRKLKAANSNPEAPVRKVQRGSGSSDELMVDSAAPSWGQNIQKMMICMMGKN